MMAKQVSSNSDSCVQGRQIFGGGKAEISTLGQNSSALISRYLRQCRINVGEMGDVYRAGNVAGSLPPKVTVAATLKQLRCKAIDRHCSLMTKRVANVLLRRQPT